MVYFSHTINKSGRPMETKQYQLLTKRRFFPLFLTQFMGAFNDNVFKNALVILITYRLATSLGYDAPLLVTLAGGLFILPFFLFSATAGMLADKYSKSTLIVIIKTLEIPLMLLAAFALYYGNVTIMFSVLFMLGTHSAFFGPLKYAILPESLADNELIAGNGMIEAGTFIAILFGTILGGALILTHNGLTIISAVMVVCAIIGWLSAKAIPHSPPQQPHLALGFNFISETISLIKYAGVRSDVLLSILAISWFWLVGATFISEFSVFVKDILHGEASIVMVFFGVFSIGLAVGSLHCNLLLKGKIHATYVPLGALGISVFTFDLCHAASITALHGHELMSLTQFLSSFANWRLIFDLFLIAVCAGIYTVPLYAIIQHRTEVAHRARVIASNNIINAVFMVMGAIITVTCLKSGFTIADVFLLLGLCNLIVALAICKLLPDAVIKLILRFIFRICYRVEVKGLENYLEAGNRVVIIANHTSFLDAILLAAYLPHHLTFAINTHTAKQWWIRGFLRFVTAFPMDPTNPMALKSLIEYVKTDKRCVIFPEGRITMTGSLMKIHEGPGLIADKSHAKLVPIRIDGAQFTPFSRLKGKVRIRLFPTITITVFPAVTLEVASEIKGRQRRAMIGLQLYDLMRNVMFESSDYHKTLFTSLLDAKSIHGGSHVILEDMKREPKTYQQVIMSCFGLGNKFAKFTEMGEHVGVLLPNVNTTAITFFALQAYSRVPAMLNYTSGIHNILLACQTSQLKVVLTSSAFIKAIKLEKLVAEMVSAGLNVIYLEDIANDVTSRDKLKAWLTAQFPQIAYWCLHYPAANRAYSHCDASAVILFTSGSEGTPKGVVLSHRNIQANRYQLSSCVDFNATDIAFNALPLFHSFGLTGGLLLPILSGVKIFLYPSPLHYRVVPQMSYDCNATIIFGTDTFLNNYAKYADQYDFYSIRYVFAGAEKLREETQALWTKKLGVRILEGYGATETSPVISTNTPMHSKSGTVGRLLPGILHEIIPVPGISEGGVLRITGPNVMKGYLLAKEPGVLVPPLDGWYDTGDIVTMDESGYVTILGRVKRFAKIAGEMVSLLLVENAINKLWPEYQHAVVNVPDDKKGERLILLTTNSGATREALIAYGKELKLADFMIPKELHHIDEMFLLGTGKVDYQRVKDYVLDEKISSSRGD